MTLAGGQLGNVQYWLNVPFGKAPVGALRFAPTQKPDPITGVRDATQFGPGCFQNGGQGIPAAGMSEDCLNLNVYAPASATAASKLPVVVFVYGGSFNSGYNSQGIYDGRLTLQGGAQFVLVTINYRVGPLGFLSSPALQDKGFLNAGLLDQKLAFEWVRANIAKFGGDATKVTAMGHSAGAISLGFHMIAQGGTQKLFDRAILLSGSPALFFADPATAQPAFDFFAQSFGCTSGDQVACLQQVDASAIQQLQNQAGLSWTPTLDGTYIPLGTQEAFFANAFSKIPVWIDSVANEGTFWAGQSKDLATSKAWVAATFPFLTDRQEKAVQKLYDISTYSNPLLQSGDIFGDAVFYCPSANTARTYTRNNVPVYRSVFNHKAVVPLFQGAQNLGVFHGSNLPFVFQITPLLGNADEVALAQKLLSDIAAFASGTSNVALFSQGQTSYVTPVSSISVVPNSIDLLKCAFWVTTGAVDTFRMQLQVLFGKQ
ncbi:Alpha/Beta hydrolase protein [Gorgonomyces haynaldii]|nr:Alpha/Beta hydrolase protein [Gorgonomyces haynaldii]